MSDDVVDISGLYPIAWGSEHCTLCRRETFLTDAWGTPWCEECWYGRDDEDDE